MPPPARQEFLAALGAEAIKTASEKGIDSLLSKNAVKLTPGEMWKSQEEGLAWRTMLSAQLGTRAGSITDGQRVGAALHRFACITLTAQRTGNPTWRSLASERAGGA